MTFDLKKMIHALHGITFRIRFPSNKDNRKKAIRESIMEDHSDVIIPKIPCCEMINGFIPDLLKWHQQSLNDNSVPLIKYVKSYYNDTIPEYLVQEFELFSDSDYKCIEYFPYIYQKVFLHQLEEFRIKDETSLNTELQEHSFKD